MSASAMTSTTAMAIFRRRSPGSPSALKSAVAASVNAVKLTTSPATITRGRLAEPLVLPAKMIGRTGRTHGEIAVTMPATNAMPMRVAMRGAVPERCPPPVSPQRW